MAHKVIYVEWEDSSGPRYSGWQGIEGWLGNDPMVCHSVGLLLWEDKKQVVIAGHWHGQTNNAEEMSIQGCMRIPKSAIRKRLNLLTNGRKRK